MKNQVLQRRALGLLFATVGVAGLGGCGGSESGTDQSAAARAEASATRRTPAPAPTPSPAPAPTPSPAPAPAPAPAPGTATIDKICLGPLPPNCMNPAVSVGRGTINVAANGVSIADVPVVSCTVSGQTQSQELRTAETCPTGYTQVATVPVTAAATLSR